MSKKNHIIYVLANIVGIFFSGLLAIGNAQAQEIQLKTNLLYDAMVVPNISAEMHLGRNYSIALGYWYTWWSSNPSHKYWRSYGGEIDLRKYFGKQTARKTLTGHHLGVVSQMGMYDVERGKRGYMSDFSYTIGAEYGYSFPIARRLSLDLALAVGYFGGTYKVYDPIDNHYVWQETRTRKWFGPVKADVTLAFQLWKDKATKEGGLQP